jgi:two-component system chemotaxis response regulator CheY
MAGAPITSGRTGVEGLNVNAIDTASNYPRDVRVSTSANDVGRRPLKVLLAEDDDVARRVLAGAVCSLGYECREARDGLEAWEMHCREPADVIISDWQMPHMDGLELCRRTRVSREEGTYTYFILMTAFDDMEHFARGMEVGADDYHPKPVDLDELRARLASASRVLGAYRELAEKNAILRRDSQASFRFARIDSLTQVANRFSMDEDLKTLWSRAKRYGHGYSVAICDVDRFKAFNDHLGHVAGDEALRRVAQAIRSELREGDGLYRYGGEEFLVLLPEQPLAEATSAMNRVRGAVEGLAIPAPGGRGVLTISVGVADLDSSRDPTLEDWLRRADAALYRAKSSGRNRVATTAVRGDVSGEGRARRSA